MIRDLPARLALATFAAVDLGLELQGGADARDQLAAVERLGDIAVGAGFECLRQAVCVVER